MQNKNPKIYAGFVRKIDAVLDEKRLSYALLSAELNIPPVSFYNKYKAHGFTMEDIERILRVAVAMPKNMIACLKCGTEFMPKTKSVKRAFCEACKAEMREKIESEDTIKFKYPVWVKSVVDSAIKSLVEQEFHIDEDTARLMSFALTAEEAKSIRANRWRCSSPTSSSVVYDAANYIKFA